MKLKELQRVLPQDFNIDELYQACCEGRLFRLPAKAEEKESELSIKKQVADYVGRIASYASADYADGIGKIWDAIINDLTFTRLVIKKRSNKGEMNKYYIISIVAYMSRRDVYDPKMSVLQLYYVLEQTRKRTSVYTSLSHYILTPDEEIELKAILNAYKGKSKCRK